MNPVRHFTQFITVYMLVLSTISERSEKYLRNVLIKVDGIYDAKYRWQTEPNGGSGEK